MPRANRRLTALLRAEPEPTADAKKSRVFPDPVLDRPLTARIELWEGERRFDVTVRGRRRRAKTWAPSRASRLPSGSLFAES
jgi:hypothetical protein